MLPIREISWGDQERGKGNGEMEGGKREEKGGGGRERELEEGMARKWYLGCSGDVGCVAVEHGGVSGWIGGV